jgi:hypothetical protein
MRDDTRQAELAAVFSWYGPHQGWLRGEPAGRRADLRGADLTRADLRGADLRGAVLTGAVLPPGVPVVPDLDRAILAEIEAGGTLQMGDWHTCETAHCRAGWAITLAGAAGADLEAQVGPAAAGALIYAASRPNQPVPNFYASNDEAMADLIACAGQAVPE